MSDHASLDVNAAILRDTLHGNPLAIAALDALVAELDEAQDKLLAATDYIARAEAAESNAQVFHDEWDKALAERDEARNSRAVQDADSLRKVEAYDDARAEVKRQGYSRAEYVLRAEAAEAERDEAIACLQRVVEADRDDSRMGHPNAGDSCIGACIGLDVMPWLDMRGKLLPFVARAAPTKEEG